MSVEVGDVAPDFTLQSETGDKVTLSDLRGGNVVLVFYPLDFSPVCTRELRDISSVADKYAAQNATVLGISVDSRWTHAAFKRDEGLSATLLADFHPKGTVAGLYGVYLDDAGIANRGTFVIDSSGKVAYKVVTSTGEARNQDEYLEALAACPV
ncbi:MAG TPA: peroxiredoxin [Candidatus Dormibacteraeota bacterium]|jgi:peroxiredoxin|nr:peroxiredoxin [Candidatus Dormibacteraeota bacterium]